MNIIFQFVKSIKRFCPLNKIQNNMLYKFYSCKIHNIDALANSYLWFSIPKKLNDPFDCDFEGYRNSKTLSSYSEKDKEEMYELFRKFGICSFTQNFTNQHFWSLYAENYSGFCLVFDKNMLERNFFRHGILSEKVDYKKTPFNLDEISDEIKKDFEGKYWSPKTEEAFRKVIFRKNKIFWGHENEVRAFLGKICIDNSKTGKNNVECGSKGYKVPFNKAVISEIILGQNISTHNKSVILNLVKHNYPHIKISQIELNHENWKLEIKEISK